MIIDSRKYDDIFLLSKVLNGKEELTEDEKKRVMKRFEKE